MVQKLVSSNRGVALLGIKFKVFGGPKLEDARILTFRVLSTSRLNLVVGAAKVQGRTARRRGFHGFKDLVGVQLVVTNKVLGLLRML